MTRQGAELSKEEKKRLKAEKKAKKAATAGAGAPVSRSSRFSTRRIFLRSLVTLFSLSLPSRCFRLFAAAPSQGSSQLVESPLSPRPFVL